MTIEAIIDHYFAGRTSDGEAALQVAHVVDSENVNRVMTVLPDNIFAAVSEFVAGYHHGEMIWFGGATDPGPESIEIIRGWLIEHGVPGHEAGNDMIERL